MSKTPFQQIQESVTEQIRLKDSFVEDAFGIQTTMMHALAKAMGCPGSLLLRLAMPVTDKYSEEQLTEDTLLTKQGIKFAYRITVSGRYVNSTLVVGPTKNGMQVLLPEGQTMPLNTPDEVAAWAQAEAASLVEKFKNHGLPGAIASQMK